MRRSYLERSAIATGPALVAELLDSPRNKGRKDSIARGGPT